MADDPAGCSAWGEGIGLDLAFGGDGSRRSAPERRAPAIAGILAAAGWLLLTALLHAECVLGAAPSKVGVPVVARLITLLDALGLLCSAILAARLRLRILWVWLRLILRHQLRRRTRRGDDLLVRPAVGPLHLRGALPRLVDKTAFVRIPKLSLS